MNRLTSFEDVIGHEWLVELFTTHLKNNTLPHFIILEGPEGLGKTSIADLVSVNLVYGFSDSDEKSKAIEQVILNNGSNSHIKRFKCSIDGGKDVAKEILSEMTTGFTLGSKKVVICDECHNFSEAAQDVFLTESEFMKDNTYLFMLTTDVYKLKASLRSRAVLLHLYPLTQREMLSVLRREVQVRHLTIQNEEATLSLIAEWAEYKPRTGLNLLKAFADNTKVSTNQINNMIGYLSVKDVLPLLESLSGSMTFGLNYISTMKMSNSLFIIVAECVKVKSGGQSYKLVFNEIQEIRQRLKEVTEEQLIKFLYGITKYNKVTMQSVMNAYIFAHSSFNLLSEPNTKNMLQQEQVQKSELIDNSFSSGTTFKAPTIDDLLINSEVVE